VNCLFLSLCLNGAFNTTQPISAPQVPVKPEWCGPLTTFVMHRSVHCTVFKWMSVGWRIQRNPTQYPKYRSSRSDVGHWVGTLNQLQAKNQPFSWLGTEVISVTRVLLCAFPKSQTVFAQSEKLRVCLHYGRHAEWDEVWDPNFLHGFASGAPTRHPVCIPVTCRCAFDESVTTFVMPRSAHCTVYKWVGVGWRFQRNPSQYPKYRSSRSDVGHWVSILNQLQANNQTFSWLGTEVISVTRVLLCALLG